MAVSAWLAQHWFDLLQTVGIVGGLVFTGYAVIKDERARVVGNLISIQDQYVRIWKMMIEQSQLARVLKKDLDLKSHPITDSERLFVQLLIVHLDTVRRATREKMFVEIERAHDDVRDFFGLPIPKAVWEEIRPFQDSEFITFVEAAGTPKR